jgi:flagellar L-ring protein precursor FlgH
VIAMKKFHRLIACSTALAMLGLAGCAGFGRESTDAWAQPVSDVAPPRAPANGAIYQSGYDVPLFENVVARRVGDVVTIRLIENTAASKSSTTTTKKTTSATLPGPTIAGRPVTVNGTKILDMGMGNDSAFDGAGSSQQSNKISGDITVTIVQRLASGNLAVRGEKWITINQGREFVRVSGVVRPIDIEPDNSVPSSKVANASISYAGKGALADANSPGWLARFFNSPKMPF